MTNVRRLYGCGVAKAAPLLWIPEEKGPQGPVNLNGATTPARELGAPGRCLMADLYGDAIPDILQLFTHGILEQALVLPGGEIYMINFRFYPRKRAPGTCDQGGRNKEVKTC